MAVGYIMLSKWDEDNDDYDLKREKRRKPILRTYEIKHLLLIDMQHHLPIYTLFLFFLNVWLTCILTLITAQH